MSRVFTPLSDIYKEGRNRPDQRPFNFKLLASNTTLGYTDLHVVGGGDSEDLRVDDEARPCTRHLHVVLVADLISLSLSFVAFYNQLRLRD
jgi:hypothetical protein